MRRQSSAIRRARPKQLDQDPTVFDIAGAGGAAAMSARPGSRSTPPDPSRPLGATVVTDDEGQLVAATPRPGSRDPDVVTAAREIASRLALRPRRTEHGRRSGGGPLASVPFDGGSTDIDLDRTLDALAERRRLADHEVFVRDRVRRRRAVVLVVDVSGSMRGERIRTAAATLGAMAGELDDDDLGVVAFWSDAAVLLHTGQTVEPLDLVDRLLDLPNEGLTNVAFGLQVAEREVARSRRHERRVVLLSDCVHNAGPDPGAAARRLPRLDVLCDVTAEHDLDLARQLARNGRGLAFSIRTARDVAPALTSAFER